MASIACYLELGTLKQHVYILDKENKEDFLLSINEIPDFIAKQKNVGDVFIGGANREFLKQIESDIKKIEKYLYNKESDKIFYYV